MVQEPLHIGLDGRKGRPDVMGNGSNELLPSFLILLLFLQRLLQPPGHHIKCIYGRRKFIIPVIIQMHRKISLPHLLRSPFQFLQGSHDASDNKAGQEITGHQDKYKESNQDKTSHPPHRLFNGAVISFPGMVGHDIKMVRFVSDGLLFHEPVPGLIGDAVNAAPVPSVQPVHHPFIPKDLHILPALCLITVAVKRDALLFHHHIGSHGIRDFHDPGIPGEGIIMAETVKYGGPENLGHHIKLESALRYHMVSTGRIEKKSRKGGSQHKEGHEKGKDTHHDMA